VYSVRRGILPGMVYMSRKQDCGELSVRCRFADRCLRHNGHHNAIRQHSRRWIGKQPNHGKQADQRRIGLKIICQAGTNACNHAIIFGSIQLLILVGHHVPPHNIHSESLYAVWAARFHTRGARHVKNNPGFNWRIFEMEFRSCFRSSSSPRPDRNRPARAGFRRNRGQGVPTHQRSHRGGKFGPGSRALPNPPG